MSNVCHGTGCRMAVHMPQICPPESILSWTSAKHSLHHSEDAFPATLHIIHSKILYFTFYLLLSKDTLTKVHCLQPVPSLLNNPPNPRAILVTFIVPYASEYLTILNYCYFLKNNSTLPSEFHFRILVLLLFLALFLSSS